MNRACVIAGSTRAGRIGRYVAEWVRQRMPVTLGLETELIDLADWNLPFSDEPHPAATGLYTQEHTRDWSQKVASADGFVSVTTQYK